ncbi:MAG: hypothetical protein IJ094_08830 [Bacilli bacterium]|nr:hypothetical protein [Bacilli bacterium]
MLDKHKKIIENKLNNKDYEVSNSFLKVKLDNKKEIVNTIVDNKSIWYIDNLIITVDEVNINDCIGIITIASGVDYVHIKILSTEVYLDYHSKNVKRYDINSFNADMILAIIEDFNNKNNIVNNNELSNLFELIIDDIDNLFIIIEKNKKKYIDEYNYKLNKLRADFVINESKILKKIKLLNGYSRTIDKL